MYKYRRTITINPHSLDDQTSALLANLIIKNRQSKVLKKNTIYRLPRYDIDIRISHTLNISSYEYEETFRCDIVSNTLHNQGIPVVESCIYMMGIAPSQMQNHLELAHFLNSRPEQTFVRESFAYLTSLPNSKHQAILVLKKSIIKLLSPETYLQTYRQDGGLEPIISFYTIDPQNLCSNTNRILAIALNNQPNIEIINNIIDPETNRPIFLKYSLIKDANHHPSGPIYHVISDNMLGSGGSGKVYPILSSLQYRDSKLELIDHPKLVVKIQNISKHSDQDRFRRDLINEYTHSKDMEHLLMQRPIETHSEAYSLMRYVKGIEALEMFSEIAFCKLSTNFRFKVTLSLLEAYIQQIHIRLINHLDIKLENVMLCLKSSIIPNARNIFLFDPESVIFKIIDLAYAKKYNSPIDAICGSLDYVAPEMMRAKELGIKNFRDEKPDVYALGNCLKIFWGFISCIKIRSFISPLAMQKTYNEFFDGVSPNLSFGLFRRITNAINNMNRENPKERSNIFQAFLEFQDIYQEYQRSIANEQLFSGLKNRSGLPFFPSDTKVYANNVNLHTYDPQYGLANR